MSTFWQAVLTSGVFTLAMTLVVTRVFNSGFNKIDRWQKLRTDEDFLFMTKLDKLGNLTLLMAQKMHDQGMINGDLEELQKQYRSADEDYDAHIRRLASEVLRR